MKDILYGHEITEESIPAKLKREEAEMNGWQEIDSAPRDGTPVLVWNGIWFDVAHAAWEDKDGNPEWFNGDTTVEPTHWQDLPPPPENTAEIKAKELEVRENIARVEKGE